MKEEIERLCQKHTDLSRKEINYIKQISLSLPFLADIYHHILKNIKMFIMKD